jgi:WD40 repeat protein
VLLWDPSKQHEHIFEKHAEVELISEAISSDGRMLAFKRGEGYLLWDPSGAKRPQKLFDYPGDQFRPTVIRFSRRGKLMAALDRDRGVGLWNIDDGKQVKRLTAQQSIPERMEVSPSDAHIASVDIDGGIVGWNIETGASRSKDAATSGHARSLAFSLDGKKLASGGLEGDVHVWSADNGKLLIALKNPESNVLALAFSPDGKRLAASAGSVIVMWNVEEKTIRRSLRGHHSSVTSLAFSSNG